MSAEPKRLSAARKLRSMENGKIVQVMGPVVDVQFKDAQLPFIRDALTVTVGGEKRVMEVSQHVGGDIVRCIMLSPSEGLSKDMEVVSEGGPIKVPVGDQVLGRLFNVFGEAIDKKGRSTENHQSLRIRALLLRYLRPESR